MSVVDSSQNVSGRIEFFEKSYKSTKNNKYVRERKIR